MTHSTILPKLFRRLPIEWRLKLTSAELHGYRHPWAHSTTTKFPREFGPINLKNNDVAVRSLINPNHKYIDCSSTTSFCVISAFPDVHWTMEDYGDLQVFGDRIPNRIWSPLEAVERRGVGRRIDDPTTIEQSGKGRLSFIVQGWRKDPKVKVSGHALLVFQNVDGTLATLESTNSGGDGLISRTTTWDGLKQTFPWAYRVAILGEKYA